MPKKKLTEQMKSENIEDTTVYPEFIPTFDQWTSYERQQENTKHLEEIAELNEPKNVKRRGYEQIGEQVEKQEKKDKKK